MLLTEVQPQLTLVPEVEVTFFTLRKNNNRNEALHTAAPRGGGVAPPLGAYMVGLLSRVDAHVALERLEVAEVRPADLAGVRLLSSVD